jgi:hypothetical protein
MNLKFVRVLLVASFLGMSCGGTSINSADEHATKACNISKQSDGSYSEPYIPPAEKTWNIDDDLAVLEEVSDKWMERASEASAASQEDAGYATLSLLTSDISAMRRDVVSTRKNNMWAVTNNDIYGLRDWSYLYDNYNPQLAKYQSECQGLSTRLND